MADASWMDHPDLKNIDKSKLQFLLALTEESNGKSPKELLPFLLAAASRSKARGVSFTSEEVDTVMEVLKIGKSPQEIARMEKVRNMMNMLAAPR